MTEFTIQSLPLKQRKQYVARPKSDNGDIVVAVWPSRKHCGFWHYGRVRNDLASEAIKNPMTPDGLRMALGKLEPNLRFTERPSDQTWEWMAEKPPARSSKRSSKGREIYFVEAVGSGCVKIGTAKDGCHFRIAILQCGCPFELSILASIKGSIAKEFALHRRFKHLHVRGEWFRFADTLKTFVEAI